MVGVSKRVKFLTRMQTLKKAIDWGEIDGEKRIFKTKLSG
jgi:hypothetical protein